MYNYTYHTRRDRGHIFSLAKTSEKVTEIGALGATNELAKERGHTHIHQGGKSPLPSIPNHPYP